MAWHQNSFTYNALGILAVVPRDVVNLISKQETMLKILPKVCEFICSSIIMSSVELEVF
jgi:hypothetical protein